MSNASGDRIWPQMCADLVEVVGIKHGRVNNHFERLKDLYQRCVFTSGPNNVRVTDITDITARRAELSGFHALVRASITHIQTGWPTATKSEVRDAIEAASNTGIDAQTETINGADFGLVGNAIDTALCLWLSVDCVDRHHLGATIWLETETVEQFVLKRRFDVAIEADPRDHVKYFPQDFRAAYLKEISGIRIEQTYYLDQHLRFNEETRTVKIFMDVAWLKAMIQLFQGVIDTPNSSNGNRSPANRSGGQASAGCRQNLQSDGQVRGDSQSQGVTQHASSTTSTALPTGNPSAAIALLPIFQEALHTIDVVFPSWHEKTTAFLETFREDGSKVPWFTLQDLTGQEQRYLHNFRFWRFRLTQLIVEYQSPPRDLKRIWNDRRNPTAYWTFWIGMAIFFLTLIFGIIASVLGGLALRNKGD